MQSELRTRLKNDATVSGIVGTRIDWVERPQAKALPAMTLQTISDPRPQHMGGDQATRQTLIQMDSWAESYKAARDLANAGIACLESGADVSSVRFLRSFVDGDRDLSERTDTQTIYRVSVDLRITHTTIP